VKIPGEETFGKPCIGKRLCSDCAVNICRKQVPTCFEQADPLQFAPMEIRDRILEAAKRVYAKHGFRGATTRLIAIEADVNEVTIFRTFGSKAALFDSLMHSHIAESPMPVLPDEPAHPERELTRWCASVLMHMRENRSLLRKSIGEVEERPDAAVCMCEGPNCAGIMLTDYILQLQATGQADVDADIQTAVSMLMSALFGDALMRDIIPNAFPQPQEVAVARYVRTILRAVGVRPAAERPRVRSAS
jgi:AcrR family transcriptional regulator